MDLELVLQCPSVTENRLKPGFSVPSFYLCPLAPHRPFSSARRHGNHSGVSGPQGLCAYADLACFIASETEDTQVRVTVIFRICRDSQLPHFTMSTSRSHSSGA